MFRRDFLKAITAFAAAVSAGAKMPSGREVGAGSPPSPPPPPAPAPVVAETPWSLQDAVIEKLKECDVVSYERVAGIGDFDKYVVTYTDDVSGTGGGLRKHVEPLIAGRRPVAIAVTSSVRNMDITHLGQPWLHSMERASYEIEVTWA